MSAAATLLGRRIAPPTGELASIQALRFIAAFIVVVYHAGIAGRVHGLLGPAYDGLLALSVFGEAGVHIFFVISGFIMVYATRGQARDKAGAATFLSRRFMRIYPVYWFYAALYLAFHLLVLGTFDRSLGETLLALALALWPGYSAGIIGPGWTLSYEVYFYLAFGLCFVMPAFVSLVALTLALCGMIAAGILIDLPGRTWQVITNPLILEFLAGAWSARVLLSGYVPARLGDAALALGLLGFAIGVAAGIPDVPTVVLWGVPGTLVVFGLAAREAAGGLPRLIARLSPLGDGSYSLYLIHNLVLDLVLLAAILAGASAFGPLVVLLGILASCILGQFAYVAVERPFYAALRRRRGARPSLAPAA